MWRGREFRSHYELEFYKRLIGLKKKYKFKVEYEEGKLEYQPPPPPPAKYIPDWTIERKDGTTLVIETKGYFSPADRKKMLAVRASNPDITFVLVFQQNNKLYRAAKKRYSDWAEENGFDYSIDEIKEEWLQ